MSQAAAVAAPQRTLFGHPLGLYTLFFTEMWERFSFYGMKTLLMLYMLNHFFWSQEDASGLLGTYSGLAYGLPVLGGFIADRYIGARRAIILGAVLLSIGHLLMAFEPLPFFYSGLGFIIAGVGFLKPNVSTQVGSLYKPGDPRRDGAFTIFYMGINVGALIGPLLCDWLRVNYGYHYGFAAAGVGMVLGLIVYVIGQRHLVEFNQDAGEQSKQEDSEPVKVHPPHVIRDRVLVLLVVFAFVILFWTAFEQSPNALLVGWADQHTNLRLFSLTPPPVSLDVVTATTEAAKTIPYVQRIKDWFADPSITSGQSQSFNPFFIIILGPVFAWFWLWLDRRKKQPSTPTKMVTGIALVAVAFAILLPAAAQENRTSQVSFAALPPSLKVDDMGAVYSEEQIDAQTKRRVDYGATRLHYDADKHFFHMDGVLPDLDRLRLLAESAPADFKARVNALAKKSVDLEKGKTLTEVFSSVPSAFAITGVEAPRVLKWDPVTKTLIIKGEIKARAKNELLAAAADPGFKEAIDTIYIDSARFRVSIWWLIAFYMCLTCGELCLSPVGLSLVTKLAPPKRVGLFMGGWFLATAIAEKLAQVFGGHWGKMPPAQYFMMFIVMCAVGALLMALLIRPLKRRMHSVT